MLYGLFSLAAAAAGPLAVGWEDRVIHDPTAGTVPIRVYYPAVAEGQGSAADPSQGPYPLAGFLHGWLGSTWMYDTVCADLASYGYVVASLDTETGLVLNMDRFADDAVAMLHAVDASSADPQDPLAGMVSDADWTALGHSMGGATLGHLLGLEPRIRTAVAFMPYEGQAAYYDAVRDYDGALLVLSGTHDTTAPPALQQEWMDAADHTSRSLLVLITDMGHTAVTDLVFGDDPLPDDLQRAIVTDLGTTFVRAEHGGDESLWADLLGPLPNGIERQSWSRSHDPVLVASLADGQITVGVAGLLGATGEVFLGTTEAELDVTVGTVDLADGVGEATVDVPSAWTGDLYVAVRTDSDDGPAWTRTIGLVTDSPPTGTEPPLDTGVVPDDEAPDEAPAPVEEDDHGCSTVSGTAFPWILLLGLRRRRR